MVKLLSLFLCAMFAIGAPQVTTATTVAESVLVPIIMYHSVTTVNQNAYVLSPEAFEKDIKYLKSRGYTAVFVSELVSYVKNNGSLPDKPIVISIDDGFYNNCTNALPILAKYGFKATISVVGKFIEREVGEYKRSNVYSYLNYNNMKEMQKSGSIEFANHTYDLHKIKDGRKGLRQKQGESAASYKRLIESDSEKCRLLIKDNCGINLSVFTYPYGYYSNSTPTILKNLGYKAILTCSEGINKLYRGDQNKLFYLSRYNRPSKNSTSEFFEKVVKL